MVIVLAEMDERETSPTITLYRNRQTLTIDLDWQTPMISIRDEDTNHVEHIHLWYTEPVRAVLKEFLS